MVNSDVAWEKFGSKDPYFGVVSHDRFRGAGAEGDVRDEFFASGSAHVEHVFAEVRDVLDPAFDPKRALDFGCGVGRIVIPLARQVPHVVGLDVSSSMLQEARANCQRFGTENVALDLSDDGLTRLEGLFDFIHSFIVFQHIPPRRGEEILKSLLRHLSPNGIGVLHFTYGTALPRLRSFVQRVRATVPLAHNIGNLIQGRSFSYPLMQMNSYDLNRLFDILRLNGCHRLHVRFTDHGRFLGVVLFFQKQTLPLF